MPLIRKDAPHRSAVIDETVSDILEKLASGSVDERRASARLIAQTSDSESAVTFLNAALEGEAEPRVREAIFSSLVRIGGQSCVAAAISRLSSDDANLRTGALDALRAMGDAVRPALPGLLKDPDPDVRILACEVLRSLPGTDATALLTELLRSDDQANVCAAAVDVLAEVGPPDAIAALNQCAERFPHDPFLGFATRLAAERIGVQQADLSD